MNQNSVEVTIRGVNSPRSPKLRGPVELFLQAVTIDEIEKQPSKKAKRDLRARIKLAVGQGTEVKTWLSNFENGIAGIPRREQQHRLATVLGIDVASLDVQAERWATEHTEPAPEASVRISFPNLCDAIEDTTSPVPPNVADVLRRVATETGVDFDKSIWQVIAFALRGAEQRRQKSGSLEIVRHRRKM